MAMQSSPFGTMVPISVQTSPSTALTEEDLNKIQLGLDAAGLTPVVGAGADILNTAISLARGNKEEAALSALATLPFVGQGFGGAKIATKGAKATQGGDFLQTIADKGGDVASTQKNVQKTSSDFTDIIPGMSNKQAQGTVTETTGSPALDELINKPTTKVANQTPNPPSAFEETLKDVNIEAVTNKAQARGNVPVNTPNIEPSPIKQNPNTTVVAKGVQPDTNLEKLTKFVKENPIKTAVVGGAGIGTTGALTNNALNNNQTTTTGGDQVTPPVDTSVVAPQSQPVIPEIPFEQRSQLEQDIIRRSQAGAPLIDPSRPEGFDPTGTLIEQPTMQEFLGAEQPAPERPKAPIEIMTEVLAGIPQEQRADVAARYLQRSQEIDRARADRESAQRAIAQAETIEAAEAKEAEEKKAERKRMRDARKLARAKGFKGSAVNAEARRVIAEEDRQIAEQEARISEQQAQREGVQERFDVSQAFREKVFVQDQKNLEDKIAREDAILADEKATAEQKAEAQADKDELTNKKLKLQIGVLEKAADSSAEVDDAVEKADRLVEVGVFKDQSQGYLNFILNELGADPEDILGLPPELDTLPKTDTPREPTDEEKDQFLAAAGGDEVKALELIKQNGFL
jgi:hypothetical protein